MSPRNDLKLQIPQGTESYYREEAYRHRRIIQHLETLMTSWGYLPVETPVFDFYDIYRPLLNRDAEEKIYRLIDREGELLMLRSDITLFMARHTARLPETGQTEQRFCYADTILRHEDPEDISHNEFYQTGAELIGKPGKEGDAEILLLLHTLLDSLGLSGIRYHLGSRALFQLLPQDKQSQLKKAITIRDRELFRRTLEDLPEAEKTALENLFFFIGTPEELSSSSLLESLPGHYRGEAEKILGLSALLTEAEPAMDIRIDFSEIGSQPYYTGTVFSAYIPDASAAAASGGRYDNLLGAFGKPAPSVGFSLLLRQLEPFISDSRFSPEPATPAAGSTFTEKYRNAADKRRQGKNCVLGGNS